MVSSLLSYRNDMINRVSFQSTPKATKTITLKNALPDLLPMR
jgi:hypothetical protein